MSRSPDYGTWVTIVCGIGLGLSAGWVSDHYGVSENIARAAAYTVGIFVLLAAALRPAWRRPRMWFDLVLLLIFHVALLLPLVSLLDSHLIRLNWAFALPFVALEFLALLGLLWRRNVRDSSP
jgi:hypothetical protein